MTSLYPPVCLETKWNDSGVPGLGASRIGGFDLLGVVDGELEGESVLLVDGGGGAELSAGLTGIVSPG